MENQQALALMKEKLREKEREIRNKDAIQAKNEERIKRVLSLSEEKIVALKKTVSDQEEKIHSAEKESTAPSNTQEILLPFPTHSKHVTKREQPKNMTTVRR